jgi:hypothetical protein
LALYIENLVPNFWICKNGTISTSLALLAGRWHHWQVVGTFFFPDDNIYKAAYNFKLQGIIYVLKSNIIIVNIGVSCYSK